MTSQPGKTVLVTGAGSGIGEAIARLFAGRGARVALLGRTREKLERVASDVPTGSARAFTVDLRNRPEVLAAVSAAADWLGHIDVLVNNAGIYREGEFASITDAVVDELIDINLKGVINTTRAALPHVSKGGAIINIASCSAVTPLNDAQAVYAMTKAGLVHFGTCLARELSKSGVRVNTVSPGATRTPVLKTIMPESDIPAAQVWLAEQSRLGRLAEPEEIASAVFYLASAEYATGAHLVVDGGTSL